MNGITELREKLWAIAKVKYDPVNGFNAVAQYIGFESGGSVATQLQDGSFLGVKANLVNSAYNKFLVEYPQAALGDQVAVAKAPPIKIPEDAKLLTLAQLRDGGDYPWAVAEDEVGNHYFVGSIRREKLARMGVTELDQPFMATVQPGKQGSEFKQEVLQVWNLE